MGNDFNKGAELDKQIYKEGEPTWGCKCGVLDVQDVKEFIEKIKKYIEEDMVFYTEECKIYEDETKEDIIDFINTIAGTSLIK